MATEIRIMGPRSEADEALRELLYGSTKFTINRIADGLALGDQSGGGALAVGEREIVLDYPRPR